jgi:hypothetical protein
MIDNILNLLFRCPHRRLTRPVTPVTKAGKSDGRTYVVCLDCGKQFEYNVKEMRIGKPIDHSHDDSVVPPGLPMPRKKKTTYALLAAVPAVVVLGTIWNARRQGGNSERGDAPPAAPKEPDSGQNRPS